MGHLQAIMQSAFCPASPFMPYQTKCVFSGVLPALFCAEVLLVFLPPAFHVCTWRKGRAMLSNTNYCSWKWRSPFDYSGPDWIDFLVKNSSGPKWKEIHPSKSTCWEHCAPASQFLTFRKVYFKIFFPLFFFCDCYRKNRKCGRAGEFWAGVWIFSGCS